jgi:hypothetical protein
VTNGRDVLMENRETGVRVRMRACMYIHAVCVYVCIYQVSHLYLTSCHVLNRGRKHGYTKQRNGRAEQRDGCPRRRNISVNDMGTELRDGRSKQHDGTSEQRDGCTRPRNFSVNGIGIAYLNGKHAYWDGVSELGLLGQKITCKSRDSLLKNENTVHCPPAALFDDILKAAKAVTRKIQSYDTQARTVVRKTDCTKPRETEGTKNTHEKKRKAERLKKSLCLFDCLRH